MKYIIFFISTNVFFSKSLYFINYENLKPNRFEDLFSVYFLKIFLNLCFQGTTSQYGTFLKFVSYQKQRFCLNDNYLSFKFFPNNSWLINVQVRNMLKYRIIFITFVVNNI